MRCWAANSASITERHVQAIWYDSALRPACLRTVLGGDVSVVDPGVWNLEAGPDFRHAVLGMLFTVGDQHAHNQIAVRG